MKKRVEDMTTSELGWSCLFDIVSIITKGFIITFRSAFRVLVQFAWGMFAFALYNQYYDPIIVPYEMQVCFVVALTMYQVAICEKRIRYTRI